MDVILQLLGSSVFFIAVLVIVLLTSAVRIVQA